MSAVHLRMRAIKESLSPSPDGSDTVPFRPGVQDFVNLSLSEKAEKFSFGLWRFLKQSFFSAVTCD
jgi:hypothetical protein